jgi:hypothetical protein
LIDQAPLRQLEQTMTQPLRTLIKSAALVTLLTTATLPAWAVTTVNLTGQLANATTSQVPGPPTQYDFWFLNLDSFAPFSVAQGDDLVVTVGLDGLYTLPTAPHGRFISMYLNGQDFAAVGDTETGGSLELFNGMTSALNIPSQSCSTSNTLASCWYLSPLDPAPYTFDKLVFTINVITLAGLGGQVTNANLITQLNTAVPVPEAQTWAMLTAGLALLGAAVRKKQRVAAANP